RFLQIGAADVAHVVLVEHRLHRMNFFQRRAHLLQERGIEDRGVARRFVGAVFVNVPSAEFEIFQFGERNEVLDQRRASLGALAQANGGELGQRSDRRAQPALNRLDSGDEGRADSADAGQQHAELAVRRRDSDGIFGRQTSGSSASALSKPRGVFGAEGLIGMEHASALDKDLFGLGNLGVRKAAIDRANRRALFLVEEADAFGAFVGDDIVEVVPDRGRGRAVEFPLRAAFVNRGVGAFRLARTAVNAFFCYYRSHFRAPNPVVVELACRAWAATRRWDRTATISARGKPSKYFKLLVVNRPRRLQSAVRVP